MRAASGFGKDPLMRILLPLASLLLVAAAPAANLSDAKALMADQRYVEAEQVLMTLAEQKKSPEVLTALAECQIKLTDLEGAATNAMAVLDQDEKNADAWKLLGRVSFAKGDQAISSGAASSAIKSHFADAEVRYKKALELNPEDPDLRWMIGWAKELEEYPDRAEAYYREQIEKFPGNPAGYRRLGALLASRATTIGGGTSPEAQKVRQQAIDVFDEGAEKAGADAESLYFKGLALEWMKKRDDAIASYVKAVKTEPELYKAWKRLSDLRYGADALLALAREVMKAHPKSPTAATWAGYYLNQKGQPEEALSVLLPALAKYREDWGVYQQAFAAADAMLKKDAEKGIAAFVKVHELYPLSGSAANNLGLYYRDVKKDSNESLKWYLAAVEREPNSQDLLNDAGLIYLFNFEGATQKKALPYLEKAVSLVQDDGYAPERGYWDALENLCKYYWDVEHDPKKVLEYAEMRYEPVNGVNPYNMSGVARGYAAKAKAELGE